MTMTAIQPSPAQDAAALPQLAIPASVAACLPPAVCEELAGMPKEQQSAFVKAFQNKSASLRMAYLLSLFYCHYGMLGRWAMTGWMCLSLFVAGTLGLIWWLIDLVRMPRMVREHNHRVATETLRNLRIALAGPAPLAGA
jgi:hypothetical protein